MVYFLGFSLTKRTQAVVDERAECSSWLAISSVVPQGSVLSPLFTFSINDICFSLKYSQRTIFPDDT